MSQDIAKPALTTRMVRADAPGAVAEAADILRRGGLVVFPTDTVYGVGCGMYDTGALARLYAAKERPRSMAIPVLISAPEHMAQAARHVPETLAPLAERFWPGALTVILPRRIDLPEMLTAGGDTIAVRMPDHAIARALIEAAGGALAVSSANRSGRPAPQTAQEALDDLAGRVELVLDGGPCPLGEASSIIDLGSEPPQLLRRGALDVRALREVLPDLAEA
ncbi:MAG: L-threonylcarbamoyladenylate synthase [Anaerolineae bacterium]